MVLLDILAVVGCGLVGFIAGNLYAQGQQLVEIRQQVANLSQSQEEMKDRVVLSTVLLQECHNATCETLIRQRKTRMAVRYLAKKQEEVLANVVQECECENEPAKNLYPAVDTVVSDVLSSAIELAPSPVVNENTQCINDYPPIERAITLGENGMLPLPDVVEA